MTWREKTDKAIERLRKLMALGNFINRAETDNAPKPDKPKPEPTPQPVVVEAGPSKRSPPQVYSSLIIFIVGVSLFTYVYYLTPVHGLVGIFKQQIYSFIPEVWATFIFDFMPGLIIIVILAMYFIGAILRGKFNFDLLKSIFYGIGAFYLIASIMIGIGYIAYAYLLSTGALDSLICNLPLTSLLQVDPNAAQKCLNKKTAAPENTKNGLTQVEQVSFGSEFTGGNIPTIFVNEIYNLPITIKNLDPDNMLNGVYVRGTMFGQERVGGQLQDKLINLVPSTCSADNPCNILTGNSQVVSLQSDEKVTFYTPGYADVTAYTYFPYVGFGKGEVYAVSAEADASKIEFPKPESGPGPVDVVVFFAPQYFMTDSKLDHIKLFVDIINRGQGQIEAKSMLIKRIGSHDLLGTGTCAVPGFGQKFSEGSKQEFEGLEFKSEAQFSCDLPIQHPDTPLTEFRGIPFTATFEYSYLETTKDSFPVRQIG